MAITKALVPVDGSEVSAKAVRLAGTLAAKQGWEVLLLHVVERPPMPGFTFPADVREDALKGLVEHGTKVLNEAEAELQQSGVNVSTRLVEGSAPEAILHEIEVGCCGILIIGSTGAGRGKLSSLLFGSVADQVVRHAKIPVLLIKQDTAIE